MIESAAAKPKRWPVALLVGLVTAIASAIICVPIADWAMEALHVSNMEGGRGYAMVCLWIPLSIIVGFAVGFVVSFLVKRGGFAGYAIRQGLALLIITALIAGVGGFAYSTADHPPLIDRKNLALDIEVRVPSKGRSIDELKAAGFSVALVVSASDRDYSDLRWGEATRTDEYITVPAWASLNSRDAGREITAGIEGENRQIFNVMLTASPKKVDEWSEWAPARERFDRSKPSPEDLYFVRYRVRFATEYSPTPPAIPQDSPVPEETPSPEEGSTP